MTVEEVRRILAGEAPREVSNDDRALVAGYRDAMTFVLRRAEDPGFRWEPELLIGLHDRILGGRYDQGAGRFRSGGARVVRSGSGEVVFIPSPADEIPQRVDDLCSTAQRSTDHPALLAAWLHIGLAAIHPFRDGNGRVARVVASLAMVRGGFKTRELSSLEEWWGRHLGAYYSAFDCLGTELDPDTDVTMFVRAHLDAQLSQVRALDLRERTERHIWIALENIVADESLPTRLATALWDGFFGRDVTAGYYRNLADISPATATNDLRAAVAARLLEARGQRRGRRYLAGERLPGLVAREVHVTTEGSLAEQRATIAQELGARLLREGSP